MTAEARWCCGTPDGTPHDGGCHTLRNSDPVHHPSHYASSSVEVIDAIEAWELGFCLGNTVKYVARAGKKDPAKTVEDLEKARWYLNREIERLTKNS